MKIKLNKRSKETVIFLFGSLLATVTLFLSLTGMSFTLIGENKSPELYMMGCYFSVALFHLIPIVDENKRKRDRISNIILLGLYLILGILSIFNYLGIHYLFFTSLFFPLAILFDRIMWIIKEKSIRSYITNALIIIIDLLLLLVLIGLHEEDSRLFFYLILFVAMAIIAFKNVMVSVFSRIRFSLLRQILLKTYAGEILLGLVVLVLASSLVLSLVEPGMQNYEDALWYCFAVITTIGFGDLKAVTLLGRILSVVIGIYGIIVVALLTSIIVNFYNETAPKKVPPKEEEVIEEKKEEEPKE